MNRREHSHRIVLTMQVTFSRNVIRQSLVRTRHPVQDTGSAGLCRPRFSFFSIQLSKIRHRRRNVVGLLLFGSGPQSVAHAALLDFTRANFLVASGAPPSLWGVYRRHPLSLSTAICSFFETFATALSQPEFASGLSQGQRLSCLPGSTYPQRRHSICGGELPRVQYSTRLRPCHNGALLRPHCRLMNAPPPAGTCTGRRMAGGQPGGVNTMNGARLH
jgi:hypothetical protein